MYNPWCTQEGVCFPIFSVASVFRNWESRLESQVCSQGWEHRARSGVTSATSSTHSFMAALSLPLSVHRSKLKTVHERIPLAGLSKLPSVPQIAKVRANI